MTSGFVIRPAPSPQTVRTCTADGCEAPAVLQWIRAATDAEAATAGLPAGMTAHVAVFGCEAHTLDLESAARTHEAACTWPAPCGCANRAAGP